MSEKITELAHIRSRLASGLFSEEDERDLRKIKDTILSLNSPFQEIALNSINNCEQNIRNNEWELAAREIQHIHNFTFEDTAKWNSDYFYKVELLNYLEHRRCAKDKAINIIVRKVTKYLVRLKSNINFNYLYQSA